MFQIMLTLTEDLQTFQVTNDQGLSSSVSSTQLLAVMPRAVQQAAYDSLSNDKTEAQAQLAQDEDAKRDAEATRAATAQRVSTLSAGVNYLRDELGLDD